MTGTEMESRTLILTLPKRVWMELNAKSINWQEDLIPWITHDIETAFGVYCGDDDEEAAP